MTQAKESFLEFLTLLKAFYLYEDESFWTNFVYAYRKTSDDTSGIKSIKWKFTFHLTFSPTVRKHFTEALYNTYEEETASRYQSLVNVKLAAEEDKGKRDTLKRKKKNTNYYSPMEMLIKHSPLVRIFYAKETLIRWVYLDFFVNILITFICRTVTRPSLITSTGCTLPERNWLPAGRKRSFVVKVLLVKVTTWRHTTFTFVYCTLLRPSLPFARFVLAKLICHTIF